MIVLTLILYFSTFTIAKKVTWKFLFLGQSNMVGNVEVQRLMTTLKLLHPPSSSSSLSRNVHNMDDIQRQLVQHFQTSESSVPTPKSVYQFEASELLRLRREGYLTRTFAKPLSNVQCSFYQLDVNQNYTIPGTKGKLLADHEKLSPNAHCGLDFGPELMFGHFLKKRILGKRKKKKDNKQTAKYISIVKIAAGGSSIKKNWSKRRGSFWKTMMDYLVVESTKPKKNNVQWKGIVWFQGEADAFNLYQAQRYEGELRTLIANLRQALFQVDTSMTFASPKDIPVVIVGLGCWIAGSPMGRLVMYTQSLVVSSTPNTILIPTKDLSCHYHYDDASQLIIGERIANALLNTTTVKKK
jgi:Carbohydrate esterase, sialic acid-specific acetylesterase